MKRRNVLIILLCLTLGQVVASGKNGEQPSVQTVQQELQLSPYFTDGMVLPRGRHFTLRGKAQPGEKVSIVLKDEATGRRVCRRKAVTSKDGAWSIVMPRLSDKVTYTLTAQTHTRTITVHGILAGELWLASGQSNMAFQLQQSTTARQDIAEADRPSIRLLDIRPRWETNATVWSAEARDSVNRLLYYHEAVWQKCSPQTVPPFSAVAYHFACVLQDSLQCPIGIICNAVGGSGEEAWIDRRTLERDFPEMLHDWTANEYIQDWVRGRAQLNMGWTKPDDTYNAQQRHPYEPCYLYDASIDLLRDMPIGGVIWYQGESNAQSMETHARLFPLLLKSWRETFHNASLPFIYTQLSSLSRPTWPEFRDLQRRQLYVDGGTRRDASLGMAVTSDVGDSLDVHPRNKRPVGDRLARWALHDVYGHACVCSGPLFRQAVWDGNRLVVEFDYADGLKTADGRAVRTFEVSADGSSWQPVGAQIEGKRIIIDCARADDVRFVRYGWQPFTRANLQNGDGLPASTFRGCVE